MELGANANSEMTAMTMHSIQKKMNPPMTMPVHAME